jgi:hypothetical protein
MDPVPGIYTFFMLSLMKRICQYLEIIINLLEESSKRVNGSLPAQKQHQPQAEHEKSASHELLDISDVLVILNISVATYYRWVKQGELIPRRKGKRHYFYKEDLLQQLEEGRRRGRI